MLPRREARDNRREKREREDTRDRGGDRMPLTVPLAPSFGHALRSLTRASLEECIVPCRSPAKRLSTGASSPVPGSRTRCRFANRLAAGGADADAIRAAVAELAPKRAERVALRGRDAVPIAMNIRPESEEEAANIAERRRAPCELVRLPTVEAAAVMPDACPAGMAKGTIPVGGIVATRDAIHPGMHSADICCSMAMTVLGDVEPRAVLDLGMEPSPRRRRAPVGVLRHARLTPAPAPTTKPCASAAPGHQAALRQLGDRLMGILHGCLKTGTTYDEVTAWAHLQPNP